LYAYLELAVAESKLGRRTAALRQLRFARALDPREPTIPFAANRVRRGLPVSAAALDRIFLRRTTVSNRIRP
jgi:hypothetical protein